MFIGIDIGGTHTRIAGSSSLEKIKLISPNTFLTYKNFGDGIFEIIKNITIISDAPQGIGIGLPGRISENGHELAGSTNLSSWINRPIVKTLEERFGCFVYIENDAVAQSLGEAYFGPNQANKFLYLVWGTGLGGALVEYDNTEETSKVLDRKYLHEWEEKIGGKNIEARFHKTAKQLNDNEWDIVLSEFKNAIQKLSNQLSVKKIVIGGGIVDKQKSNISKILSDLPSQVSFSKLGEQIGIFGGFAMIKSHQ
ncbi:MAG: ROK family protein [Patescibacteria group bacterium]|jgi:predicted NBD/HSP70 family sugar kinase